jgi:hypothetical protein
MNEGKKLLSIILMVSVLTGILGETGLATENVFNESFNSGTVGEIVYGYNDWIMSTLNPRVLEKSTIKFANEPNLPENTTANFRLTGHEAPASELMLYKNLDPPLTGGYASLKFRLRSDNEYGYIFCLQIKDSANNYWEIFFDFQNGNVGIHNLAPAEIDSTLPSILYCPFSTAGGEQNVILGKWYNFEFIFDLTSGTAATVTAYIDGVKIADREHTPYNPAGSFYYNCGDIAAVRFGISRTDGTTASDETTVSPTADFHLDDIILTMQEQEEKLYTAEITGLVWNGNSISGVNVFCEKIPDANEKILVAVYDNMDTVDVLTGVAICPLNAASGNFVVPVDDILPAVQAGNKVKVFLWDMQTLAPQARYYETVKE